jgi:hypothetical protein
LFGRIVATLTTCAVLVVAVMFSVALLAIAAIAGAIFLGWVWWKTRHVRRQIQDQHSAGFGAPAEGDPAQQAGDIIEGEVLKGEWKEDSKP